MKKIQSLATMEPKEREATELEVTLLHAMGHPNIVAYKDSFVNNEGHLCILMEYCEHGDMYAFLKSHTKKGAAPNTPEIRITDWLIQVIVKQD